MKKDKKLYQAADIEIETVLVRRNYGISCGTNELHWSASARKTENRREPLKVRNFVKKEKKVVIF